MPTIKVKGQQVRRGILYLAGAAQHLLDQSAGLVADRIARSVQDQLAPTTPFSYRITLRSDVVRFGPGIPVDIASIEVATEAGWEQAIDVIELNYLSQFVKPFADRSHLSRSWRAIRMVWSRRSQTVKALRARGTPKGLLDKWQASYLGAVSLVSLLALLYWVVLTFTAITGVPWLLDLDVFDDVSRWFPLNATVLAVLTAAAVALKDFWIYIDKLALEMCSVSEYLSDEHDYASVPNAVLDALLHVKQQDYGTVDLLGFSLGALIAGDAIHPKRLRLLSHPIDIENWITIGYPYDLIASFQEDYFIHRRGPMLRISRWINVVTADDFLGSNFRYDDLPEAPDPALGIRFIDPSAPARNPDRNLYFEPDRTWVARSRLDKIFPYRRMLNHILYWDDKDARAPNCFAQVAVAAGWTGDVLSVLRTHPDPTDRAGESAPGAR